MRTLKPEAIPIQLKVVLIGDQGLAIRKWRVALLHELGLPIEGDEAPADAFDPETFLKTMPGRANACPDQAGSDIR